MTRAIKDFRTLIQTIRTHNSPAKLFSFKQMWIWGRGAALNWLPHAPANSCRSSQTSITFSNSRLASGLSRWRKKKRMNHQTTKTTRRLNGTKGPILVKILLTFWQIYWQLFAASRRLILSTSDRKSRANWTRLWPRTRQRLTLKIRKSLNAVHVLSWI